MKAGIFPEADRYSHWIGEQPLFTLSSLDCAVYKTTHPSVVDWNSLAKPRVEGIFVPGYFRFNQFPNYVTRVSFVE
jgi:uncharacterized membrane protein